MGHQIAIVHTKYGPAIFYDEELKIYESSIVVEAVINLMLYNNTDSLDVYKCCDDWLCSIPNFPKNLEDVVLEGGKTIKETRENE